MAEHRSPHPDLVEWALGQLDVDEAVAFEAHLLGCDECRREADELRGLHVALEHAAPPFEVPAGLEEQVLRASRAVVAPPRHPRRRRRLRLRPAWIAGPLGAVAVAAALTIALLPTGSGAPRVALRSTTGEAIDVSASVRVTPVGREVTIDIRQLRDPRPDGLYELWFVAADDTLRRPDRVSAGTFHPDEAGRGTIRLLAAADPKRYPRLSVTLEPSDGNPRRTGPEVLIVR